MARHKIKKIAVKVTRHQRVYRTVTVTKQVLQCEKPYVLFGKAIKEQRAELRITQQELADATGYSRATIANIETGRQRIYVGDVIAFAKQLKMKPLDLFEKCL